MSNLSEVLGYITEAREHNNNAQNVLNGISDDSSSGQGVMPSSEDLAAVVDVLDTIVTNGNRAAGEAEEARDNITYADPEPHFTESANALALDEHARETAVGCSAVAEEAKGKLVQAIALLDEVKLSLEQITSAADTAQVSTGGAEENLKQLAERLSS